MKPRILIIDNNIDIYQQLKTAFELENFTVNHIEDGSDAVKRIFQMIPDVILLDLQLSDIDGLDLLRIISRHQNTKHIPVIVISEERGAIAAAENGRFVKLDMDEMNLRRFLNERLFISSGD